MESKINKTNFEESLIKHLNNYDKTSFDSLFKKIDYSQDIPPFIKGDLIWFPNLLLQLVFARYGTQIPLHYDRHKKSDNHIQYKTWMMHQLLVSEFADEVESLEKQGLLKSKQFICGADLEYVKPLSTLAKQISTLHLFWNSLLRSSNLFPSKNTRLTKILDLSKEYLTKETNFTLRSPLFIIDLSKNPSIDDVISFIDSFNAFNVIIKESFSESFINYFEQTCSKFEPKSMELNQAIFIMKSMSFLIDLNGTLKQMPKIEILLQDFLLDDFISKRQLLKPAFSDLLQKLDQFVGDSTSSVINTCLINIFLNENFK